MSDKSRPVRIIAIRGDRFRVAEFALRQDESGLSLFACETEDDIRRVVEAVRAAGKSGRLAAAELNAEDLDALGLELVRTYGTTPDEYANDLHVEARLSTSSAELARRLGLSTWEFFNQQIAGAMHAKAKLIYKG